MPSPPFLFPLVRPTSQDSRLEWQCPVYLLHTAKPSGTDHERVCVCMCACVPVCVCVCACVCVCVCVCARHGKVREALARHDELVSDCVCVYVAEGSETPRWAGHYRARGPPLSPSHPRPPPPPILGGIVPRLLLKTIQAIITRSHGVVSSTTEAVMFAVEGKARRVLFSKCCPEAVKIVCCRLGFLDPKKNEPVGHRSNSFQQFGNDSFHHWFVVTSSFINLSSYHLEFMPVASVYPFKHLLIKREIALGGPPSSTRWITWGEGGGAIQLGPFMFWAGNYKFRKIALHNITIFITIGWRE